LGNELCLDRRIRLSTNDGNFKLECCRKTCFLGFLSGIACLKNLAPELLAEQNYIMTYRLSQDHLELFFNAVRKAGRKLKIRHAYHLMAINSFSEYDTPKWSDEAELI
jgi:hypothetical protein